MKEFLSESFYFLCKVEGEIIVEYEGLRAIGGHQKFDETWKVLRWLWVAEKVFRGTESGLQKVFLAFLSLVIINLWWNQSDLWWNSLKPCSAALGKSQMCSGFTYVSGSTLQVQWKNREASDSVIKIKAVDYQLGRKRMKKVERIKDFDTQGFCKKGCSGCSWNKCGFGSAFTRDDGKSCCNSRIEGVRRALGMREPWWWWIIRINIIIRQINSRLWARKEPGEPGARVFKDRQVCRR